MKALRGKQYTKVEDNGGMPFPYETKNIDAIPDSMDWRLFGAVTPVKGKEKTVFSRVQLTLCKSINVEKSRLILQINRCVDLAGVLVPQAQSREHTSWNTVVWSDSPNKWVKIIRKLCHIDKFENELLRFECNKDRIVFSSHDEVWFERN